MVVSAVLYQNQADKYQQVCSDFSSVKSIVDFNAEQKDEKFGKLAQLKQDCIELEKKIYNKKELRSFLDVIPMLRRTERVPEKVQKSEYIPAAGLVSLAILNGPEDLRDMKSSCEQIKAMFQKKEFKPSYDYKTAQHPFSFFKGTLLHNFVNPNKSKYPKLAKILLNEDKTLYDTKLGKIVDKIFAIKKEYIKTNIKHILYDDKNPKYVTARKFKTKSIVGDIAARALIRTTKLGAMALGVIEGIHFLQEVNRGKSVTAEIKKSAITYTGAIAGIGCGGAIGAKYFGAAGSLIGMGFGAMIGNKTACYLNKD